MEDTTELFNTPIAPKVQTVCTKKVWRGCGGLSKNVRNIALACWLSVNKGAQQIMQYKKQ